VAVPGEHLVSEGSITVISRSVRTIVRALSDTEDVDLDEVMQRALADLGQTLRVCPVSVTMLDEVDGRFQVRDFFSSIPVQLDERVSEFLAARMRWTLTWLAGATGGVPGRFVRAENSTASVRTWLQSHDLDWIDAFPLVGPAATVGLLSFCGKGEIPSLGSDLLEVVALLTDAIGVVFTMRMREAAQAANTIEGNLPLAEHRLLAAMLLLSPREVHVVEMLLNGFRVSVIARRLFISEHTVRNHLKAVFKKLGVSSQSELVELIRTR